LDAVPTRSTAATPSEPTPMPPRLNRYERPLKTRVPLPPPTPTMRPAFTICSRTAPLSARDAVEPAANVAAATPTIGAGLRARARCGGLICSQSRAADRRGRRASHATNGRPCARQAHTLRRRAAAGTREMPSFFRKSWPVSSAHPPRPRDVCRSAPTRGMARLGAGTG
jgi:hypothetical protein